MIIQGGPNGDEISVLPSRTEGNEGVIKAVEELGQTTAEDKTPSYKASDLREKTPEVRALRVAELRNSLASLVDKTSGRSRAKRDSILYKLGVLCK